MKQKVFISSTYADLIPFRERIWEYLDNLNVNIFGMEKFGARKSSPLETCLDEVTKSDIFICIIGFRFGSIEKTSKKSFTQLEYEKAKSLNKEIMIYLMDEKALIQANNVDKGMNAIRLENFKKNLRLYHTIDTFLEPGQLATNIYDRLNILIPNLNKINIRPKILDCKLTRFNFHGEKWIAFVGYLLNKPYEIFTGLAEVEIFPIPESVELGKIIKVKDEDGNTRYDYQYIDQYGYRKTMGGLSHMFSNHTFKYTKMINTLLQQNVELEKIAEVITFMDSFDGFLSNEWKQGVKKALRKKYAE